MYATNELLLFGNKKVLSESESESEGEIQRNQINEIKGNL